jgi:NADH-quinone oxidoreductase subunit D
VADKQLVVGLGAGADLVDLRPDDLVTAEMVLNIGPQHPATHGVLRLRLTLDGERIVSAEPVIGYMHRGAEKLFEVRDYRQIIMLANRHDWLSAFANELGVVLAVERMLGMEVPVRAVWARTLLAELNRVLNHLVFMGSYPLEVGAITPVFFALPALEDLIFGNEIFQARTRGVGRLTKEQVLQYGVSGPIARGSGVDMDLRRDDPYLAYGELQDVLRVVTRDEGDCFARFEVLREQVHVSLDLAEACLDQLDTLPAGPINTRLPKVLKAPEGHTYAWTENPLGVNGYFLVSKGEKTPWRLKLRTASFNNVQVLSEMLPGQLVPDMVSIMGSMFFVVGDVDK